MRPLQTIADLRIVASPSYLKAHGIPKTAAELSDHECLLFGVDSPALRAKWTLVAGKRKTDVPVRGRFAVDDLLALRAAALGGLGLVHLPAPIIASDVKSGTLVPVLSSYTSVPVPLHIVYAGERLLPMRIRTLIDFLVSRMSTRRRPPRN